MAGGVVKTFQSSSHIFAITFLQIIIVILFLLFVRWFLNTFFSVDIVSRYDPNTAQKSETSVQTGSQQIRDTYPSKYTYTDQGYIPM